MPFGFPSERAFSFAGIPRRLVQRYVDHYSNVRLNSAVGYITPKDMS